MAEHQQLPSSDSSKHLLDNHSLCFRLGVRAPQSDGRNPERYDAMRFEA
jgi:hypothetical protein